MEGEQGEASRGSHARSKETPEISEPEGKGGMGYNPAIKQIAGNREEKDLDTTTTTDSNLGQRAISGTKRAAGKARIRDVQVDSRRVPREQEGQNTKASGAGRYKGDNGK